MNSFEIRIIINPLPSLIVGTVYYYYNFKVNRSIYKTIMADENDSSCDKFDNESSKPDKMFTLKKWNAVAMWSWDVECDTCAICSKFDIFHCYVSISVNHFILLCYRSTSHG